MFDYPLLIPQHTRYEELGIAPEAAPDEVREAKGAAVSRIVELKAAIIQTLNDVYRQVPGLDEAYQTIERLKNSTESGALDELRDDQKRLAKLEQSATKISPEFLELRKQLDDFGRAERRINTEAFDNPEARAAYDDDTPPLALLKLADCAEDIFSDNRVALHLIRQELSTFLGEQGETVFHPSDLTRRDFTADFTPNELLDGAANDQFKS